MKKKDERIIPVDNFPDPDELMPNPKHRKAEMVNESLADSKIPKEEITQESKPETQEISTKAKIYGGK